MLERGGADMVQMDTPLLAGLLAERLLAKAPELDRVYFCNSGTEAVEAALKFARAATGRRRILYCDHAFHGLTAGSLSVNGSEDFRDGFGPLLPDTRIRFRRPRGPATRVAAGRRGRPDHRTDPGKGRPHPAHPASCRPPEAALHEAGALLICDEVQTGIGRTGRFFAYEHDGVDPDIVTVAKALSGGYVPVGATLAKDWIFEKVYSSMDRVLVHDSTFGSNAMAMAAGLASLAVVDDEGLVDNAARAGGALLDGLRPLVDRYELLADVRGRGLMIGLEFGKPRSLRLRGGWSMLQAARRGLFAQMVVLPLFQRHRILTQVAGDHMDVIKLLPPLMIGDEEVQWFLEGFTDVMESAHKGNGLMVDFGRTLVKQALTR